MTKEKTNLISSPVVSVEDDFPYPIDIINNSKRNKWTVNKWFVLYGVHVVDKVMIRLKGSSHLSTFYRSLELQWYSRIASNLIAVVKVPTVVAKAQLLKLTFPKIELLHTFKDKIKNKKSLICMGVILLWYFYRKPTSSDNFTFCLRFRISDKI